MFVAKFFLQGLTCHYVDELLFSYRRKERALNPKRVSDMPGLDKPLEIWLYYIIHQIRLYKKIVESTSLQHSTERQATYMYLVSLHSFLMYSHKLIHWIHNSIITESSGTKDTAAKVMNFINKSVTKSLSQFPNLGNFVDDNPNNIRFHPAVLKPLFNNVRSSLKAFYESIEYFISLLPQNDIPELALQVRYLLKTELDTIHSLAQKNIKDLETKPSILSTLKNPQSISKAPKLSVISASFNLGKFVENTIISVANQTSKDFEHIVVDGASKDSTLNILKKYPYAHVISEKDSGYPEALRKGIAISRGRYIIQCAISDGMADETWIESCIKVLDTNPDISLVWGLPERLSENNIPGGVSYSQFHHTLAPQKEDFFAYWLKTGFYFPEGNLCVRKEVLDKCYPDYRNANTIILDWLEFSFNFNRNGYLAYHIPMVANFGRTHNDQMGEHLAKNGKIWKMYRYYLRKITAYRIKILLGIETPVFRSYDNTLLHFTFNRKKFTNDYIKYIIQKIVKIDSRYLSLKEYEKYALKKVAYYYQSAKTSITKTQ